MHVVTGTGPCVSAAVEPQYLLAGCFWRHGRLPTNAGLLQHSLKFEVEVPPKDGTALVAWTPCSTSLL